MSSRRTTVTRRAAAAALAGVALPGAGRARTDAQDPAGTPDVALLHLDGRSVRWRGDVLRDRIAVVNFVFTTCTSLCPPSSAVMAALQREPGISAAGGTTFVSLSIDPLSDSPQRLRAFARPFDPGPDWWWLTGAPGDVSSCSTRCRPVWAATRSRMRRCGWSAAPAAVPGGACSARRRRSSFAA